MYAALILVGICVGVFVLQATVPGFTDAFVLISADVLERPWILFSSIFLHGDLVHLLYNMFGLALFGMILESIIGKKRFLIVFFSAGLLASIGSALLYNAVLGASGALFGVMGTLAILRPRMQVWVSYFPMPMIAAVGVWIAIDVLRLFVPSGIASLGHLVGLGFGLGFGFYLKRGYGERREKGVEIDDKTMEKWEEKWMK